MTPPEASEIGIANHRDAPPAVSVCLQTMRKRADFLRASRAGRQGTPSMMVQARRRAPDEAGKTGDPAGRDGIRVGFTCSKKVGNAVARNRAKRRLRAAAKQVLPHQGRPGWDYVLIGRRDATDARPFDLLLADLEMALQKLHR